ncbi:MAG: AAA family ATPase, partial [Deltaproteobacteria bacterium]|nr:AAA family ATPase [Deltaproteobacteria bacterium]
MYLSFYKLKEMPFNISTDPRFLWYGEKHGEALANLTYGLLEGNGYVVMTGDAGTGKTTLVNALIKTLDDNVLVANINHPTFGASEFLNIVAKTYDSTAEIASKADCLIFFKSFLQRTHVEGKTVLLIIDEAHRLPKESLEEIRLLSNMEKAHQKLIKIFLAGQNELKLTLFSPECHALRQRITLFYDLHPLSEDETLDYVVHRLKVAGTKKQLFTSGAIHQIQNFTQGYP